MIKPATLYSRLRRRGIISATAVSLFLGAVTTTNATDKSASRENFARAATWLLNPISPKSINVIPAQIYASVDSAPIAVAAPIADYTDLPIAPPKQVYRSTNRSTSHTPASSKRARATAPIHYIATSQQVIMAISHAAKAANISLDLFGSLEWLESIGGNPNAANGSSLGLSQMQHTTANNVMRRFGVEIAAELASTNNPKYAKIIDCLSAHKMPDASTYNQVIFDPSFNALLGAFNVRMVAADQGLSPQHVANITAIYSEYLTGRPIRPGSALMGDIYPESTLASNPILGTDSTTASEAYAALKKELTSWGRKFHVAYAHADMPPLPVEATQIYTSKARHGRVHPPRSAHNSAIAAAASSGKNIHLPTTIAERLQRQVLPASADAPVLPSRIMRVAGNSIVHMINTKFTLSL